MHSKLPKKSRFSRLSDFEIHHRIITFLLVMVLSVLGTRLIVMIHNPNPALFHFELHHFDYGIALLLFNTIAQLFGLKKERLQLLVSAFATGLIIDDYWFIRKSVVENNSMQTQIYNETFPSVLVFTGCILLTILLVHIRKQRYIKKHARNIKEA